jgi:hypothetical protein
MVSTLVSDLLDIFFKRNVTGGHAEGDVTGGHVAPGPSMPAALPPGAAGPAGACSA